MTCVSRLCLGTADRFEQCYRACQSHSHLLSIDLMFQRCRLTVTTKRNICTQTSVLAVRDPYLSCRELALLLETGKVPLWTGGPSTSCKFAQRLVYRNSNNRTASRADRDKEPQKGHLLRMIPGAQTQAKATSEAGTMVST